jgi:cytochrome c oxidase subunit II
VTDTRQQVHDLFDGLYLPITLTAGVIVWAVVVFALVRFRARHDAVPSRKSEAKVVESLYAVGLVAVAVVLVWQTFTVEHRVDSVSGTPGARVDVVAFKWQWRITYPGENVRPIVGTLQHRPELVVPAGTTVRFTLRSRDVIHALWFPELRFKRDAFPGKTQTFDLVFDEPETFTARCAEFCGLDHAEMTLDVRAVPQAEYRTWLDGRRR